MTVLRGLPATGALALFACAVLLAWLLGVGTATAEGLVAQGLAAAAAGVLALVMYCLPAGQGNGAGETNDLSVMTLLAAALAAVLGLQLVPLPADWLPASVPRVNIVRERAVLDGSAPAFLPASLSPGLTLKAMGSLSVVFFAAGAARLVPERAFRTCVESALHLLAIASSLVALLQALGLQEGLPVWDYTNNAPSGFFANSNHLATLAVMSLSLAGYGLAIRWRAGRLRGRHAARPLNLLRAVAVLFAGLGVVLSGSLAGYGLAGGVSLYLAVRATRRPSPIGVHHLFVVGVSAALVAGWVYLLAAALVPVGALSGVPDIAGVNARPDVWLRGLTVLRDNWITGIGAGAFTVADPFYVSEGRLTAEFANELHNDILSLPLEVGFAGLVILTPAIVFALRQLWHLADCAMGGGSGSASGSASAQMAFLLPMMVALLHSGVDYPLRNPFMLFVFALCAACALCNIRARNRIERLKTRTVTL